MESQIKENAKKWAADTPKQIQKSALKWKDISDGRMPRGVRLRKFVVRMLVMGGFSKIGFQDSRSKTRLNPLSIRFLKEWVDAIRNASDEKTHEGQAQIQLCLFKTVA